MGIYLNPGKTAYEEAVNSEIFIDKSEMILYLNSIVKTEQKYVCVSRPRRFGKSMAAKMISAYYDREADSRGLFERCKLSSVKDDRVRWDQYLSRYDVIKVVMTDFFKRGVTIDTALEKLQKLIVRDLAWAYPEVDFFDRNDLVQSLQDVYSEKKTQFVIEIDEWDAIFREYKEDKEGQKKYLDFLRDCLKDKEYIALVYMTGILPIKKYGKHSALNMFDEYSMTQPMRLASCTGFTVEEVRALCEEYEMDYAEISDWYDGYCVSGYIPIKKRKLYRQGQYGEHRIRVYSPLSVVNAMRSGEIENYWNETENYEALQ